MAVTVGAHFADLCAPHLQSFSPSSFRLWVPEEKPQSQIEANRSLRWIMLSSRIDLFGHGEIDYKLIGVGSMHVCR